MQKIVVILLLALCATTSFAKKTKPAIVEPPKPVTLIDSISYAIGADMGTNISKNIEQAALQVNWDFIKLGFSEAAAKSNQFSDEQMKASFEKIRSIVTDGYNEKQKAFLETNKTAEGVITTPSGLQYKIVTLGTGAKPAATDVVKVNYQGSLIDGTVFDSSTQNGGPITFPLNGVIPGWTEGVQLMPVGSKFIFYVPSELGYGEQGAGGVIPPNATLIFEVELLDINPAE